MMDLSGTPGVKDSVTELGSIPANDVKGIICVQGITKRGKIGKNYLVGTWPDFLRKLGGIHADDDFALLCKQALNSGTKLRVSRAFHFDNVDDATTVEGDLATGDLLNSEVAPVAAVAELTIATWTGTGSHITITVPDLNDPTDTVVIANYNGTAAQTQAQAAAAAMAAINANTSTHKYSATNPTGAKLVIACTEDFGSLANGFPFVTNVTAGTLTGVSSEFTGGQYAAGSYISFVLTGWTGTGSNLKLEVPNLDTPGQTLELVNYDGLGAQTIEQALSAIGTLVNNNSATTKYHAILLPDNKIVFKKDDSFGAGGNGSIATLTVTAGTYSNANLKFENGVTIYGALGSSWEAEAVGNGYDGAKIVIAPSKNGKADFVDITISLPDSDLPQTISSLPRVLDNVKLTSLNKQMEGVSVSGLTNFTLPIGTVTLSGGTQDTSVIDAYDFNGSSVSSTGWHAFNDVVDSMRLFNIGMPSHVANLGAATYCANRKDMRARIYCPKGLTIQGLNDFRDGSGSFMHQPIDTWYASLWVAELFVNDPNNVNVVDYVVNGGGFQAANRSKADNAKGPWYSDSGNDFGKIVGVNGVPLNLGSAGNSTQYDSLYEKGVNAIINHASFKVVSWGNRTTLLDKTSLLSKDNIADLVVYIARRIREIAQLMNFKPNDIVMFNELYRRVTPFIKDELVAKRGIEGDSSPTRGEGKWWHWLGDQYAKDLNDLKVNQKSEIDAGKYRARFAFKPIAANEYIGIDLSPADSTTILNVQILQNLNA